MSAHPRSGYGVCRHDPCWCGLVDCDRIAVNTSGIKPWTQEGHDRFMAERKAARDARNNSKVPTTEPSA